MSEEICSNGMWLSEEVLLSKSTWEKKTLRRLRRRGILYSERVADVSNNNNRDSPFFPLTFFRVTAVNDSDADFAATQDFKVPLSEFLEMSQSLEEFVGGGVESPLSSKIKDRLKRYTGVKIPPTSLTRPSLGFIAFIAKLRKENYIMFSVDVVKYAEEKENAEKKKQAEEKENAEKKKQAEEKGEADKKAKAKTTQSQVKKEEATQSQEQAEQEEVTQCLGDTPATNKCAGVNAPPL